MNRFISDRVTYKHTHTRYVGAFVHYITIAHKSGNNHKTPYFNTFSQTNVFFLPVHSRKIHSIAWIRRVMDRKKINSEQRHHFYKTILIQRMHASLAKQPKNKLCQNQLANILYVTLKRHWIPPLNRMKKKKNVFWDTKREKKTNLKENRREWQQKATLSIF